jgi:hypothetical protein
MDWKELQNRLSDEFTTDGILGKRVDDVIHCESDYGAFVENSYKGYCILSRSIQEFYMDTLQTAASVWTKKDNPPPPLTCVDTWLWHLANFRSIRAVDILFHNGYPMDGFARLRHLKESALYLGAMLGGLTSYFRIKGYDDVMTAGKPFTQEDADRVKKNRKKEEKRILDLMLRENSGLPLDHRAQLKEWEEDFHSEVHGAFLTQVLEHGPAILGEDTTSVAPQPREKSCVMFMSAFVEVGWLLHRTLPILQLSHQRFDDRWVGKWRLLDVNFLVMKRSQAEKGDPFSDVFINFVATKFPFGPEVCFDTHVRS